MDQALNDEHEMFLEISPHPILLPDIEEALRRSGRAGVVVPSQRRGDEERVVMLSALGTLYSWGYAVEWTRLYPGGGRCVQLPNYPWQRERYWLASQAPGGLRQPAITASAAAGATVHPLLGRRLHLPIKETLFEVEYSLATLPFLDDHRLHGLAVLPGVSYLEIALAAARDVFGAGAHAVENLLIHEALVIPDSGKRTVQVVLEPLRDEKGSFRVLSLTEVGEQGGATWKLHATGDILVTAGSESIAGRSQRADPALLIAGAEEVSPEQFYAQTTTIGFRFGPAFRGIEALWRREGEAVGRVALAEVLGSSAESYDFHPAFLDACLQVLGASLLSHGMHADTGDLYLPVGVDRFRAYARPGRTLWSHGRFIAEEAPTTETYAGNFCFYDESGQLIAEVEGLRLKRASRQTLLRATQQRFGDWLYQVEWQRTDPPTAPAGRALQRGGWLIFADATGVGEALAALLQAAGQSPVLISPAGTSANGSSGHYRLNPSLPDGFRQLLRDTCGEDQPPLRGIVHLWSLDAVPESDGVSSALDDAQERGCLSTLHLIQALAEAAPADPPRVWLVTRGVQPMDPAAPGETVELGEPAVAQSTLWGLGGTIAQEHADLGVTMVDLDTYGIEREARDLFAELWSGDGENRLVLRGASRYAARLVRCSPAILQTGTLLADATYLITGGLSGLGLAVARWMVEQGARHLVLLGRSDAGPAAREIIESMGHSGAEVVIARVDVTRRDDLDTLLSTIAETMPPLRGIVHSAGVVDDGMLVQLDRARFTRVLAPKVTGAWNLHLLTQQAALDFFVLFSSGASLLGSPGQGNHAAANAFLDSLAHHRRSQGKPAL
ncbi:MAG TPA: SDR family NAD(P)-dependent oxidoreductase, partial [Chloroflexota bacterium]|nr:SDR family NAD(P)-dependent oxidoreductase [Chloroflexota bacterium]